MRDIIDRTRLDLELPRTTSDGPLQGVVPNDRPLFIVGNSGAGKTRLVRRLITENHFGEGAAIHMVTRSFGTGEYTDLQDRFVSCLSGWDGFHDSVRAVHAAAEAREGQERSFRRRVLIVDLENNAAMYFRPGTLQQGTDTQLMRLLRRGPALGTVVVFTSGLFLGAETSHMGTDVLTAVMVDYPRSDIIAQVGGARYSHRL